MFERFTEDARQVIVLAQEEARVLKHHHIGTEHLTLGLLRVVGDGPAPLTLHEIRTELVTLLGAGTEIHSGQIPFTPRAKRVLEYALREALNLGHEDIQPAHIALGLSREKEGTHRLVVSDWDELRDMILAGATA